MPKDRGDIDGHYPVPVEIRKDLSKHDALRIATVENLQREDLPPLDQASALAGLIRKGTSLDDIVAKTGLSATTIKRRLALNSLCDEAHNALRSGELSLAQAEALTLGSEEAQQLVLLEIENGDFPTVKALKGLDPKPPDSAKAPTKKAYSEKMRAAVAAALAEELRQRGLKRARPGGVGELGVSGAERRMSGGIGAKKVDVTWATEESGLLLAISVKCINFMDGRTKNFQKNLTNRRGDMLFESVTLHRKFPYAVLGGFFILDKGAAEDGSPKRTSTFVNAHRRLRLFTGWSDPAGRDEQYERLYVVLLDATPFDASARIFRSRKSRERDHVGPRHRPAAPSSGGARPRFLYRPPPQRRARPGRNHVAALATPRQPRRYGCEENRRSRRGRKRRGGGRRRGLTA